MLKSKLMEQLNNENHYTISKYVLVYAKKNKLDVNSLMLLIYFLNHKNKAIFNYKQIIDDLTFDEKELLESISILKDKKILTIEMEKNESGINMLDEFCFDNPDMILTKGVRTYINQIASDKIRF